jgi:hypothetical protein
MAVEENVQSASVSVERLWFGLAGSVAAWLSLGLVDILITWQACVHQEQFGNASSHPAARLAYIIAAVFLFLIVIASGTTSYRNWRQLSTERELLRAPAIDRREFMAMLGIFVSITLGVGVLWLAIPTLMIELCARAR